MSFFKANIRAIAFCAVLALPAIAQDQIITLTSPNAESFGSFGLAVSGASDVNSNGTADVLVGTQEDGGGALAGGRVYLFDGADGGLISTFISPNPQSSGYFGESVSGSGDVNNDGAGDILVGAPGEDAGSSSEAGHAYLFSGADGTLIFDLTSPSAQINGGFGRTVSGVGDVNNNGTADVIIGSAEAVGGLGFVGRAYVFDGLDGSLLHTLDTPNPETSAQFAISVSGGEDVNGDGSPDLIVGASWETESGLDDAGRAYVFNGSDGSLLYTLVSENSKIGGNFGQSVSAAGDANGDGNADILVGALDEDAGASRSGRAYIFSGADGSLLHALGSPNPEMFGLFGRTVSGAGDINGDGFADAVIGSEEDDSGINANGRVYVMSGLDGSVLHTLASPNPEPFGFFGHSVSATGDGAVIVGAINEDGSTNNSGRSYIMRFEGAAGIPCGDITQFLARCRAGGLIQSRVRFSTPDHNGQTVTFLIDGTDEVVATIANQRAQISLTGYAAGSHTVDISDPAGCVTPFVVNCPAALEASGNTADTETIPDEVTLVQNYPNPFNPSTSIRYGLNEDVTVSLRIYNSLGQEVATLVNDMQSAGYHTVEWNGRDNSGNAVATGMYIYTLRAGDIVHSKQMLFSK